MEQGLDLTHGQTQAALGNMPLLSHSLKGEVKIQPLVTCNYIFIICFRREETVSKTQLKTSCAQHAL